MINNIPPSDLNPLNNIGSNPSPLNTPTVTLMSDLLGHLGAFMAGGSDAATNMQYVINGIRDTSPNIQNAKKILESCASGSPSMSQIFNTIGNALQALTKGPSGIDNELFNYNSNALAHSNSTFETINASLFCQAIVPYIESLLPAGDSRLAVLTSDLNTVMQNPTNQSNMIAAINQLNTDLAGMIQ